MTDEKFFAWLDGELSGAEALEVAALVASDPELSAKAQQHRALSSRLQAAFAPLASAPVPARITSPLQAGPDNVVSLSSWRARLAARPSGGAPQWAAMAATLAIGILLGTMVNTSGGGSPIEVRDGAMFASADLDSALDRQLASAGAATSVRVGLTFRDQSGAICRSFTGQSSSGVACRQGEDWRLKGLFEAPEGQGGDYRMAAGQDPNLAALIDSTIAGDAFDAEQEKAARERGWR
jgi:hypothetical protein